MSRSKAGARRPAYMARFDAVLAERYGCDVRNKMRANLVEVCQRWCRRASANGGTQSPFLRSPFLPWLVPLKECDSRMKTYSFLPSLTHT